MPVLYICIRNYIFIDIDSLLIVAQNGNNRKEIVGNGQAFVTIYKIIGFKIVESTLIQLILY